MASRFRTYVEQHLHTLTTRGLAAGPDGERTAFWMSAIDLETWDYPAGPPAVGKRVYRNIDAPRGSSLYWDQPTVAACFQLAATGSGNEVMTAANRYMRAFLERCVARNGLFLWGNHYFYKPSTVQVMRFVGNEEPYPVDFETEVGDYYETRPLTPEWERLWEGNAAATEKCLRAMAHLHLFDAESGGFNRHADQRCSHAFLESGGVLVQSLAFLAAKTGDQEMMELALRIARWSFGHRDAETGLVENQPCYSRWDKFVCTSEIGHWALSLVGAATLLKQAAGGEAAARELEDMAAEALRAYLRYAFDQSNGRYFGQVCVLDGSPVDGPRATLYEPDLYCNFWHPLFPRHDYPFQTAEACAGLWQRTGDEEFLQGLRRWVGWLRSELPANGGKGAHAEFYGRTISLLRDAASVLKDATLLELANYTAGDAVAHLWHGEIFAGHPGEARYDAVDGVGYLLQALLELDERNAEPPQTALSG